MPFKSNAFLKWCHILLLSFKLKLAYNPKLSPVPSYSSLTLLMPSFFPPEKKGVWCECYWSWGRSHKNYMFSVPSPALKGKLLLQLREDFLKWSMIISAFLLCMSTTLISAKSEINWMFGQKFLLEKWALSTTKSTKALSLRTSGSQNTLLDYKVFIKKPNCSLKEDPSLLLY